MPSYKTHSIHGEIVFSKIKDHLFVDKEMLKLCCVGPDAMIFTDYKTFDNQHMHKTKEFFFSLIQTIKERKLQYDSKVMAFLYGQLDHFVLDAVMHPYIYFFTEKYPNKEKIPFHGMVEMWIDDYITKRYSKRNERYYSFPKSDDQNLKWVIDSVYQKVFGSKNGFSKYHLGMRLLCFFDSNVRCDSSHFFSRIMSHFHIGDITYHKGFERIKPFLNRNHKSWFDPETKQERHDSFDDLWSESIQQACQLICDVQDYMYFGKEFTNPLLLEDISYNTGHSCENGQHLAYVKKYNQP